MNFIERVQVSALAFIHILYQSTVLFYYNFNLILFSGPARLFGGGENSEQRFIHSLQSQYKRYKLYNKVGPFINISVYLCYHFIHKFIYLFSIYFIQLFFSNILMLLFLAIQFGRFAILQPGKTKLAVFSQICKPGTVVKYIHPLFFYIQC